GGEARLVPTGLVEAGVVGLAVVDAGGLQAAAARLPAVVGRDPGRRAVGVGDPQLGEQGRVRAPLLAALEACAVPAVAEDRADRVVALLDQAGDIVGLR